MTKTDYQMCTNRGGGKIHQSWEHQLMERELIKLKLAVIPEAATELHHKKRKKRELCNSIIS
jgi:hypothetical protein